MGIRDRLQKVIDDTGKSKRKEESPWNSPLTPWLWGMLIGVVLLFFRYLPEVMEWYDAL